MATKLDVRLCSVVEITQLQSLRYINPHDRQKSIAIAGDCHSPSAGCRKITDDLYLMLRMVDGGLHSAFEKAYVRARRRRMVSCPSVRFRLCLWSVGMLKHMATWKLNERRRTAKRIIAHFPCVHIVSPLNQPPSHTSCTFLFVFFRSHGSREVLFGEPLRATMAPCSLIVTTCDLSGFPATFVRFLIGEEGGETPARRRRWR